jgi:hypothetical protein
MRFSHIAYPGSLAELAAKVISGEVPGKLMEFTSEDRLIGVGVVSKENPKNALFVADVTKKGLEYADVIISRTANASSTWSSKTVRSVIPKEQLEVFRTLARWKSETSTDIPVTRLL